MSAKLRFPGTDSCRLCAEKPEMGSRWWSAQPPPLLAILTPCALLADVCVSKGGLERRKTHGGKTALLTDTAGVGDRRTTAESRGALGGPLVTASLGAT